MAIAFVLKHYLADEVEKAFNDALKPKANDRATTESRMASLRSIFSMDLLITGRREVASEMRSLVRAFHDLEHRASQEELSDSDEQALVEIGLG
ncbi:hypothetical protein ACQR16_30950 [Bradyrhizobium oligotrophicum]|uniref:hypothetical protein n=1 Tax=Bradyrhizobium oligotrophicum TaxID=44255 RepID=UPI003EBDA234